MSGQQAATMTPEQAKWASTFTGLDVTTTAQSHAAPAEGPAPGVPFSLGVPKLPKKTYDAWGGRIAIEIEPVIKVAGNAQLLTGDGKPDTAARDAAALKVANGWNSVVAEPALAKGGLLANMKIGREGTSLAATASTETPLGKLSLKFIAAGVDFKPSSDAGVKGTFKVLQGEAELIPHAIHLKDTQVDDLKLTKLTLEVGGKVTMGPDWERIIVRWAVESAGKEVVAKSSEAAGEMVVAAISIEGVLIVGGVAAVGAMIYALVQAWGIGDLAQGYKPGIDSARAGFKAGFAGGKAPGDAYGKVGHDAGARCHDELFKATRTANPEASDEAIRTAIAARADEALDKVADVLDRSVRSGLWNGYLAQHTFMLAYSDARWAFAACFGHFADEKTDPEWKTYVAQHKYLS